MKNHVYEILLDLCLVIKSWNFSYFVFHDLIKLVYTQTDEQL